MSVLKSLIKRVVEAGGDAGVLTRRAAAKRTQVLVDSSRSGEYIKQQRQARQAVKEAAARAEADKQLLYKAKQGVSELIQDLNDESYMAMADHAGIVDEFKATWGLHDDDKFNELLTVSEDVDLFSLGKKKKIYSLAALDDIAYYVSKHGDINATVPEGSMLTQYTPSAVKVTESQLKRPRSAIELADQMTKARKEHMSYIDKVKARYLQPKQTKFPRLFEEYDVDSAEALYSRVHRRYEETLAEYPIGTLASKKEQYSFAQRSIYRRHLYDSTAQPGPFAPVRRGEVGTRSVQPIYNEVLDREVVRAAGLLDRSYDAEAAADVLDYYTKNPDLHAFDNKGKRVLYDPEDPRTLQVLMSRYHDTIDAIERSIDAGRQPFDVKGVSTDWDTIEYGYIPDPGNGLSLEDLEFYRAFNKLNITLSEARAKVAERFASKVSDGIKVSYLNKNSARLWYEGGIDAVLKLHDEALAELSHLEGTEYEASAKAYYQAVRDMLSLRDPKNLQDAQLVLHEIDVMASWEAEAAALQQISKHQEEVALDRAHQASDIFSPPGKYDTSHESHLIAGGGPSIYKEAFSDIKLSGEELKRDMAFTSTSRGYDTSQVLENIEADWVEQNELSYSDSMSKSYLRQVGKYSPSYMRTLAESTIELEKVLAEFETRNWDKVSRTAAPEIPDSEEGILEDILQKKAAIGLLQRFPLSTGAPRYNAKVGWNNNILRLNTVDDLNKYIGEINKQPPTPLAASDPISFMSETGLKVAEDLSIENRDLLYKAILATRDDVARANGMYLQASAEDKLPLLVLRDKNLALLKLFQDRMAGALAENDFKDGLPTYLARWDLRAQDPIDFSYKVSEIANSEYGSIVEDIDYDMEDIISYMLRSLETEGVDGTSFVASFKNSPAYLKATQTQNKARTVIINRLTEDGPTTVIEKQNGEVVGQGKDYLDPGMSRLDSIIPEK